MWILNFIPTTVFYGLALLSVAALVLIKFIPLPTLYIRAAAILLLTGSIYFIGANANNEHWQQKVAAAEKQALELALQAEELNQKLALAQGQKREVIIKRQAQNIRFIEKEIIKYDKSCEIPKEFVEAHNRSAERPR